MITVTAYTDNPKEFNQKVREAQSMWHGCIDSLACENCGAIHTDSICLCVGIFDCLECGYKNGNRGTT